MQIRAAATVLLVRDRPDGGVEVFTQRRRTTMAFAPGAIVFPGGAVDPGDADPAVPWRGPGPDDFVAPLSASGPDEARALVVAAVRETFEECGVLLASSPGSDALSDPVTGGAWEARRRALDAGTATLAGVLTDGGAELRADTVLPWAHWLTPDGMPRRYDTRFFLAQVPAGQEPRDVAGEAADVAWRVPGEALAGHRRGEFPMLPPQVALLTELSAAPSVADLLARPRRPGRITG